MNHSTVYDDDILEWSEQQAAALRRAAHARPNVSNEIDWENVAEEIESVGRSQFLAVESLLRQILIHLIKAVSIEARDPLLHWRKEVVAFHTDLMKRMTPSMRFRLDQAEIWRDALRQADADLAVYGQSVAADLRKECPLSLAEILDADFDFLAVVEALRGRYEKKPSA
jgi:hypothetical protein